MSAYLDAAVAVLKSTGRPMSVREITERALARGLIVPQGKTPMMTMRACLYLHVRDGKPPLIKREYEQREVRAARRSVRWVYIR